MVQNNLLSPSLGVDEICRELGISRSRLYRLFEDLGGVVHYIRSRRLLDAHRVLSGGMDRRPIVNIAAERDFLDPADFSRAFKREFGYSPKEARLRTRPPTQHQSALEQGGSFGELLSRLH
jgi:AraC-like DNA-binding protein